MCGGSGYIVAFGKHIVQYRAVEAATALRTSPDRLLTPGVTGYLNLSLTNPNNTL